MMDDDTSPATNATSNNFVCSHKSSNMVSMRIATDITVTPPIVVVGVVVGVRVGVGVGLVGERCARRVIIN